MPKDEDEAIELAESEGLHLTGIDQFDEDHDEDSPEPEEDEGDGEFVDGLEEGEGK